MGMCRCLSLGIVSYIVSYMSSGLARYVSNLVGRFNVSLVHIGNDLKVGI